MFRSKVSFFLAKEAALRKGMCELLFTFLYDLTSPFNAVKRPQT